MLGMNMIIDSLISVSSNLSLGIDLSFFTDWLFKALIQLTAWSLGLVKSVLTLIFDLASLDFFGGTAASSQAISDLSTRVYIILGVLMLFKITISCIQYLINPDKSEDKESGFGGIIKRTLIAVILLAVVPAIFTFAKDVQGQISEALPRVILGAQNSVSSQEVGEDIAYSTILGFFGYSSDACNDGSIAGLANANGNVVKETDSGVKFSTVDDISKRAIEIVQDKSCSGNKRYSFNYLAIFAGIFLVIILVSMALDIGIRTIKFGFLQIIAPVPIASYIDPKTSKKSFDTWVQKSVSIYIDLFIRLGVIYFIIYLFKLIFSSFSGTYTINGANIGVVRSGFVNVAIIIAMFMFAKSAPKFITEVLGIKGDGNLGDMFKRAGGFAGAGLGAMKAGYSNYKTQRERLKGKGITDWRNVAGALKSAAAGAGSAQVRGMYSSVRGKGFSDVYKSSSSGAIKARDARNDRIDNLYSKPDPATGDPGYGRLDYLHDKFNARMGIPSAQNYTKVVYDAMDGIAQSSASEKSFGATKMMETPNEIPITAKDGRSYTIATAKAFAEIEVGQVVTKPDGTTGAWTIADRANALQVQQEVEKATSYVKTAKLLNARDATALMNHQKTILSIKNNKDMFRDSTIMTEIVKVFRDKHVPDDVSDVDKLLHLLENMPTNEYEAAKVFDAMKTSFENIRTAQYAKAQAAEARAKKTQQATQNDKK